MCVKSYKPRGTNKKVVISSISPMWFLLMKLAINYLQSAGNRISNFDLIVCTLDFCTKTFDMHKKRKPSEKRC